MKFILKEESASLIDLSYRELNDIVDACSITAQYLNDKFVGAHTKSEEKFYEEKLNRMIKLKQNLGAMLEEELQAVALKCKECGNCLAFCGCVTRSY